MAEQKEPRPVDNRPEIPHPELAKEREGAKSLRERQDVAEEKIRRAKAEDQEDTREETSGDERHDLVWGKEINIPPSIEAERLRNGQNPETGAPWSREDRMRYDKEQEQARQAHAKAVRESERQMRKEQAEAPLQPVSHIPASQMTEEQKKAMQEAQDSGKGPVAQARARDEAGPEARGKREADEAARKEEEALSTKK